MVGKVITISSHSHQVSAKQALGTRNCNMFHTLDGLITVSGFNGGFAGVRVCWWASSPALLRTQRKRASSIVGLQAQADIRDTEFATDATSLSATSSPPRLTPYASTPEISISQPSPTSPSSQSHNPSSVQLQTNYVIWSKSRKDHHGIFSHDIIVFSNQPRCQPIPGPQAATAQTYTN